MVLLGYNGRPSEVISLSGGKNVTITKTSLHGGGEEDKLSIVALPQYAGAKNTMPTILIPAPGDSSVRIIVNKMTKLGHSIHLCRAGFVCHRSYKLPSHSKINHYKK